MAEPILKLTRGVPRTDREWMDVFKNLTKFFRVSGDELIIGGDIQLPAGSVSTDELADDAVTDPKLRESQACSVIGRSANSAGQPTDIQATVDGQYLRRSGGTLAFGAISDSDIPSTIARDTEVSAAITAHEGASDPHPGYTTSTEATSIANAAVSTHEGAADPHPVYTTAAEVSSAIITALANITSGTYTPTLTNTTNIAASTAYECQYLRVGSTVTVSGRIDVDPTTASIDTLLGISLPIASNFGGSEDCAGAAAASGIVSESAAINADSVNDRAQMIWVTASNANHAMFFSFTYQVI
jgi:hypothetical protein